MGRTVRRLNAKGELLEDGWQAQVVGWLRYYGWTRIYHAPHGAHGGGTKGARVMHGGQLGEGRGFPDLVALKGPRLLIAELKTDRVKKLGPGQPEWIAAWESFGASVADAVNMAARSAGMRPDARPVVDVHVWRPRDVVQVLDVIGRGSTLPRPTMLEGDVTGSLDDW